MSGQAKVNYCTGSLFPEGKESSVTSVLPGDVCGCSYFVLQAKI